MAYHGSHPRQAQGGRSRPWSPPVYDNSRGHVGNIDHYLAHSSHGWGNTRAFGQEGDDQAMAYEDAFRRHQGNLRAAYEAEYDSGPYYLTSTRHQRRDPSDISVDALDLADYARTLRRADVAQNDPYPPFPPSAARPFSREPWSPIPSPGLSPPERSPLPRRAFSPPSLPFPPTEAALVDRPFSAMSQDTMMPPPSLISAGTTSHSSHTNATSINYPNRRPFSLPADYSSPRGPAIFAARSPPPSTRAVGTGRQVHPDIAEMDLGTPEVNVASFPPWARKWYKQEQETGRAAGTGKKGKGPEYPRSPVEEEIFGPYIHPNDSQRDLGLLPWTSGNPNDEPQGVNTVPDNVKEERIRMLEREFGNKSTNRGWKQSDADDGIIGSVDAKGNLITAGPKKRATMRWLQAIFAIGTAVSGIYGALFIKLKTPAPPSGRAAAYILYVLSILTPILLFFFFVITPLCLRRKKDQDPNNANPAGMMVLPVAQPAASGKKKKGKWKGGKNGPENGNGSVQVNLIVDPGMFNTGTGRGRGPPGRYDDEDYDEGSEEESTHPSSRRKGRRRRRDDDWDSNDEERAAPPRRRSIFTGLAMERAWRRARRDLKKRTALDILLTILWTGCFVMIMLGQRCPPGTLDGWCDAYNIATACSSVLIVLFGTSAFFDIKDLRHSKVSPRTRT
ncbi:hypothetical protein CPB86DRAFT_755420 [Serendipita vermifera]|nr:hypothetical protein CPB86DRAFT_755420 [Serendipita vermifera]